MQSMSPQVIIAQHRHQVGIFDGTTLTEYAMKLLQLLIPGLGWHAGLDSHNQPVQMTSLSAAKLGRAHAVRGTTIEGAPPHVEACQVESRLLDSANRVQPSSHLICRFYSRVGAKMAAEMAPA